MTIKNNEIRKKINYLSNIPETDKPFITLYLNINAHDYLGQLEKDRIFLKDSFTNEADKISDRGNLESFKKDEKRIKDYIDENIGTKAHGLAIFACDAEGIFEVFQSYMSFENEFVVDMYPHLKQLAIQADEFESSLVLMIDAKHARIFTLKLGGILTEEADRANFVHRRHKQGGWSQMRYERHIENQIEHHYAETAKILTDIEDSENYNDIILIGQEQELKNFEKHLPKRILDKVTDTNNLQMRENVNEILNTIIDDLYKRKKEKDFAMIQELINGAQMNDNSTLGIQDIVTLAKEGRIATLSMVENLETLGYKCGECLYISKDQYMPGCPKCNGDLKETNLTEEVIKYTFKNGGNVEFVENETPSADELLKHEGIGANLRY